MKNKLRHLMTWLCCCSLLGAAVLGLLTPRVASASSVWITLKQISQNSDDGFYGAWGFYPDLVWNESGNPGQPYNAWYRFGINLEKGSAILEAHLEIMETSWTSGTKLRIYAEDSAAPVAPGSIEDANTKLRTTAYVDWTYGYSDGLYHNSPDFAPVIQELVNSYSLSTIQILVDDNGSSTGVEMVGRTFEYGTPPRLFIKYQAPVAGNTTGRVASTPQPTGGANEYAFNLKIISTKVPGLSYEQEVWCAATTTDFPDLLAVGAVLSGNLDHSLGWWILKGAIELEPAPVPPSEGKIVFSSLRDGANQQLYMINPDGSSIVRLTNNTANDYWPTWSPDGRKISFISDRDGNNEIYMMNADGTGVTRLTNNAGTDSGPVWSRDSKTLVFVSDRDGNLEIYRIDADGTNEARLTNNPAQDLSPTWSPDGSKISFASNRSGSGGVYVMDSNGNNPVMVGGRSAPAWWDGGSPAWSPSDMRIAFLDYDQRSALTLVNSDGTNLTSLNFTRGGFSWSTDGGKIAYTDGQQYGLRIAILDGSATRADVPQSWAFYVAWSPDSKWLVYSVPTSAPASNGLAIINVETADRIQLTTYLDGTTGYVDSHPSWGIPATTPIPGNTTGTVASTPQPTGGANEYALNLKITSTTVPGLTVGQQVWCAASTTDFPNLLTVGTTLTGNLDNSLGWWVLKKAV